MERRRTGPPAGRAVLQESVTQAIAAAVFAELADVGYGRLTMEGVARRAGVGKAALYRRWPGKEPMVLTHLCGAVESTVVAPDTGSLAGDVAAYLHATWTQLAAPQVARIVADLVGESVRNAALADGVRQVTAEPRRAAVAALLEHAVRRGELPVDVDRDLAADLLVGPLAFRSLLMPRPEDVPTYLRRLTATTVAALQAARTDPPPVADRLEGS